MKYLKKVKTLKKPCIFTSREPLGFHSFIFHFLSRILSHWYCYLLLIFMSDFHHQHHMSFIFALNFHHWYHSFFDEFFHSFLLLPLTTSIKDLRRCFLSSNSFNLTLLPQVLPCISRKYFYQGRLSLDWHSFHIKSH